MKYRLEQLINVSKYEGARTMQGLRGQWKARYYALAGNYSLTSWEYIQRVGKAPVFGSIIFFPIISAALRFDGSIRFYFFPVTLPWKMHILYFGLFFLFVGSLMFAYHCPGMFKKFLTHHDYARSEIETLSVPVFALNSAEFIRRRLKEHRQQVSRLDKNHIDNLESALSSVEEAAKIVKDSMPINDVAQLMLCHWKFMNRSLPGWRVAIFISYSLGLSFLVAVSALSFVEVISYYVKKLVLL